MLTATTRDAIAADQEKLLAQARYDARRADTAQCVRAFTLSEAIDNSGTFGPATRVAAEALLNAYIFEGKARDALIDAYHRCDTARANLILKGYDR